MYAVIFRAEILELDAEYAAMARRMRDLAIDEYGCVEFVACTEGNTEIAISYWESARADSAVEAKRRAPGCPGQRPLQMV